jgi:cystathionine gamma-synthase
MTDTETDDSPPAARHPATIAAQAAGHGDRATGGLVGAIHPATTFERGPDYGPGPTGDVYIRDDNATVREAEAVIAALEGAAAARLFASGMAAIAALLRAAAPAGRILVQRGTYYGTTVLAGRLAAKAGAEITGFDPTDLAGLEAALAAGGSSGGADGASLVLIETPSNPWLAVVDIAAAAEIAHRAGASLAVDSTAATPILTRPLELGADIVMHSATKALDGHSDVLAGVLATRDTASPLWADILAERHDAGAVLSPFAAWLLTRGMRTVDLRVRAASANALAIARRLDAHPGVAMVRYPGLPSHPGHAIARRQMAGGFGMLLSFDVDGGADGA